MPNNKDDGRYDELHPPCYYCRHLTELGQMDGYDGWTCPAYPDGIDKWILQRIRNHTVELGDQEDDLVYESEIFEYSDDKLKMSWEGDWENVGE